ncbi:MAG: biopolymer transporter ExbD, partial [Betaproteobacteria bacterium]|nr:biopolymer transporter ExbD [Betaproteobacteria bacterium]
ALLERQQHPDQLQVTLAGDKDTSLQQLMAVMDACRKASVTKIGLAARQGGGSGS